MSEQRPQRSRYDVIVVGARCAGATTARLLAQAGFDVLVVDRTRLPADTVSTHALMLPAVIQLRRWGLLDAVVATGATAIDAVDVKSGDVEFTARVKNIGGVDRLYAPRRITLDALLADAAVAAGAELCTGTSITGLLRNGNGRVTGVAGVAADGRTFSARARWVVGADGVRSTIADLVDAPVDDYRAPTNASQFAYWSGLDTHHYEFTFAPGLGAGAIPTDGGLTCIYANFPVGQLPEMRRDVEAGFHRILRTAAPGLSERVRDAERVTGFRGVRGLPAYLRKPWGPGWLLVGDAGYHRDPYSAHGITDAFRDAELAARGLRAALLEPVVEADAMTTFHLLRDDFAVPMFDLTARMASYEWTTDEVLELMSLMGDEGEREAHFLTTLPSLSRMPDDAAA